MVGGGAHLGQSIERFRARFRDPRVRAFEPVPEHVDALEREYGDDAGVTLHAVALGAADGDVELVVNEKTATSPVRRPVPPYRLAEILEPAGAYEPRETVTVRQVRLDSATLDGFDVLKLDRQGYELEALRGAGALLEGRPAVMFDGPRDTNSRHNPPADRRTIQ